MAGDTISIFPIMMIMMMVWRPIKTIGDVWTSRNSNSEPNEYIEGLEDGSLKVVTKKFPPLVQLLELFFFVLVVQILI
uniref:ER membrane protein complex subunit 4 n=1 Tax=Meloidogyne enterolobii TaxID=390850 RepID=A0A6V7UV84_MELEN|nr:unnamed protein product [Meloidogyne enterolobii]